MKQLTAFDHMVAWFVAFVLSMLTALPVALVSGDYIALGVALVFGPTIGYAIGQARPRILL